MESGPLRHSTVDDRENFTSSSSSSRSAAQSDHRAGVASKIRKLLKTIESQLLNDAAALATRKQLSCNGRTISSSLLLAELVSSPNSSAARRDKHKYIKHNAEQNTKQYKNTRRNGQLCGYDLQMIPRWAQFCDRSNKIRKNKQKKKKTARHLSRERDATHEWAAPILQFKLDISSKPTTVYSSTSRSSAHNKVRWVVLKNTGWENG